MKTAEELAIWDRLNGHNLEPCALCGELGLPEEFSDRDDDHEYIEILVRYRNSDCRMDGELLCDECSSEMDRLMMNIEESTTRRLNYYRRQI